MRTREIVIDDADRRISLKLRVTFQYSPASPSIFIRGGSWEQPEGESVDVQEVELQEVTVMFGDLPMNSPPWLCDDHARRVGLWIQETYCEEIEEKLLEMVGAEA